MSQPPSLGIIPTRVRALLNDDPEKEGVALFIFLQHAEGEGNPIYPAHLAYMGQVKAGEKMDHSIMLPPEDAQNLFDDLWKAGIQKPSWWIEPLTAQDAEPTSQRTEDEAKQYKTAPPDFAHAPLDAARELIAAKDAHIADLQAVLQACLHKLQS